MAGEEETGDRLRLLTPHLAIPVAIFAASRFVTVAVLHAARLIEPQSLAAAASKWDGRHYLAIAAHGYPAATPQGSGSEAQTVHAFFPGYPMAVRGLRSLTGMEPIPAALAVNVALATVAAVLIWLLARDLVGEEAATRAVALFSFFPGAYVLGMVYSEGTFLAFAAACLLALQRRRWVVAGVAAAIAGATRPTGLVLFVCCIWAAAVALRERKEWLALAAPIMAPIGFIAWSIFLDRHTGSPTAWLRSQERGWGRGLDFGLNTATWMARFLAAPLRNFNLTVAAPSVVLLLLGLVLLWRWRSPAVLTIYTLGVSFAIMASGLLISTPRLVLSAFPLHIAAARSLSDSAYTAVLAVSAGLMAVLMLVATTTAFLAP